MKLATPKFALLLVAAFVAVTLGAGVRLCYSAMPCCKGHCPPAIAQGVSLGVDCAGAKTAACGLAQDRVRERVAVMGDENFSEASPLAVVETLDASHLSTSPVYIEVVNTISSNDPPIYLFESRLLL